MKLTMVCLFCFVLMLFTSMISLAEEPAIKKNGDNQRMSVLAVTVSNFKDELGDLVVSVYANKEDWLSENKVQEQREIVAESLIDGEINLQILLPEGEYAISVYQDRNSNGKLDSNFIGIPKEPAAVSNNAPARFGPPKYQAAKFQLTMDAVSRQTIKFK